jgi:hypothetical protein
MAFYRAADPATVWRVVSRACPLVDLAHALLAVGAPRRWRLRFLCRVPGHEFLNTLNHERYLFFRVFAVLPMSGLIAQIEL